MSLISNEFIVSVTELVFSFSLSQTNHLEVWEQLDSSFSREHYLCEFNYCAFMYVLCSICRDDANGTAAMAVYTL